MAESRTYPQITRSKVERIVRIPYNIQQVKKTNMDGGIEQVYTYNEHRHPDDNQPLNDTAHWNNVLARKLKTETAESDMKVSILANKTDQQIQDYINTNITDLTSTKQLLYKLTKEVRDIIRRLDWD